MEENCRSQDVYKLQLALTGSEWKLKDRKIDEMKRNH
jgi:hypothetical protein